MNKHIDSASWTGSDGEHKGPTLMEMIDKYVPVATRGSVTAMALSYEKEITALLRRYHALVEQYEAACERMHELQKEAARMMPAIPSLGKIEAGQFFEPYRQEHHVRLVWDPGQYAASIAVYNPCDPKEYPETFKAACAELRRTFERELPSQIEEAYADMCRSGLGMVRT